MTERFGAFPSSYNTTVVAPVVTDLIVISSPPTPELGPKWHRIEKELLLYTSQQIAWWLYVALANEEELRAEDLVVVDISVGEQPPSNSDRSWESRDCGIWVLRREFSGKIDQTVTEVDVLFGVDAVDPRPRWALMQSPLQLETSPKVPVARLSVLRGRAPRSETPAALRVGEDGKFKILQISDTHVGTGPGVCKDAIDKDGNNLPGCDADPRTVKFIEKILDVEKPDLVILAGDQLHHDVEDSHTALLKLFAPIIERSTPFAVVFGNHDSEGKHALSRKKQMSILQNLPFSLCMSGPDKVDGIGNYYLQVLGSGQSPLPLSTLYFLDSHSQISEPAGYDHIKPSQIEWFTNTSQEARTAREKDNNNSHIHLSLAFLHIPLPEFGDSNLSIVNGQRREATEGPSINSHFYDALVKEGISALGCGHDHLNDFCALLPQQMQQDGDENPRRGPWLCYGGGSGFGGYCSYGKWPFEQRFYRQMRVWELDTSTASLKTWKRVEYNTGRVDELVLVESGVVVDPAGERDEGRNCVVS